MSHLGNTITRIMRRRTDLSAAEISRMADVTPSTISKLISGTVSASPEVVTKLATAIGRNKTERAELILAHMKDSYGPHFEDCLKLIATGKFNTQTTHLNPDIEHLQKHWNEPGIRQAVRGIVELHGTKRGNGTDPTIIPVKPKSIRKL